MSHIDEGTLHSYLDGEVGERERAQIEDHLATCEECRGKLEVAEALSGRAAELLAELEPAAVQVPSWRELEERAAARRRAEPRRLRLRPGLAWAASIALAFAVGWAASSAYLREPGAFDVAPRETVLPAMAPEAADAPELRQRRDAEAAEETAQPRAKSAPEQESVGEVADRAQPQAPTQRGRDDRPAEAAELTEQDRAAEAADELVVVETPPAVAGVEVAREEGAPQAAMPMERAEPEMAHRFEAQRALAVRGDAEEKSAEFFEVPADEAAVWLGTRLRTLPELTLQRMEVGPGATVEGTRAGLPAVRLFYEDAAGNEIVLTQQWVGLGEGLSEIDTAMTVEPSGHRTYRWLDGQGYLLILEGEVSGDSLRALAARVR